jgi:shikimate dehydrogenase
MTVHAPRIVVTLPGRTIPDCRAELAEAAEAGADLAELRLDRWSGPELEALPEIFPAPIPVLGTFRSRAEGGEGSDDPIERARVLQRLLTLPFAAIDREIERDPLPPPSASHLTIWSRHAPQGTAPEAVWAKLRTEPERPGLRKVVVPATLGAALDLVDRARAGWPDDAILHTTGPSGPLLRALGGRLGLAAVFAALPSQPGREAVDPAQIPVDQLARFLRAGPGAPLFALLGADVARSPSPELFGAWMGALDLAGLYISLGVGSVDELTAALPRLVELGFRGFNVTRPWKIAALALADDVRPAARACGSANVLTAEAGGAIVAENTDLAALLRRLGELREQGQWDGRTLLTVGTGGAARAGLAAAREMNADSLLLGRDPGKVDALGHAFGARRPEAGGPRPGLIVQASAVGRADAGPVGFDLEPWIGPGTYVLDLVYRPEVPLVRRWTERGGGTYEDGMRLLAYQAAAAFGVWLEEDVPDALVDEALQRLR